MDKDIIYRQDAIDAVIKRDANCGIDSAEVLKDLPSAQPEPSQVARDIATIIENEQDMRVLLSQPERKKGKWERHYTRPNVYKDLCWHCSECGYKSSDNWADKWNYCPNCGCEMER